MVLWRGATLLKKVNEPFFGEAASRPCRRLRQRRALLRFALKKLREGDTASLFLEKQPPGGAGDCFAFGSQ
jgi:hypothetical protein